MGHRGHPLMREITLVLALKAAAIAVIWLAFFGPETRPDIDGAAVEQHLTVTRKAAR
ncbi:MAG: hypothetical protein P8Z76_01265 [Alphaproteobacteria bacterium]|jgi:hypothetical protein